jgi:hypothetical protein
VAGVESRGKGKSIAQTEDKRIGIRPLVFFPAE